MEWRRHNRCRQSRLFSSGFFRKELDLAQTGRRDGMSRPSRLSMSSPSPPIFWRAAGPTTISPPRHRRSRPAPWLWTEPGATAQPRSRRSGRGSRPRAHPGRRPPGFSRPGRASGRRGPCRSSSGWAGTSGRRAWWSDAITLLMAADEAVGGLDPVGLLRKRSSRGRARSAASPEPQIVWSGRQ